MLRQAQHDLGKGVVQANGWGLGGHPDEKSGAKATKSPQGLRPSADLVVAAHGCVIYT
jgi:hypothetical protein